MTPNTTMGPMNDHERHLERVQALLAKAHATNFQAEADAFMAKAQALMTRYAIDELMLDDRLQRSTTVELRPISIPSPYARPKFALLSAIANTNHCRAVFDERAALATLVGEGRDIAGVEVMYASLLLQATDAMTRHGSVTDLRGRSRTRAFRRSFLMGFAAEVHQRLISAREEATSQAAAEHGSSLLPMIARRDDELDRAVGEAFPNTGPLRLSHSSGLGFHAGTEAGTAADLDTSPVLRR